MNSDSQRIDEIIAEFLQLQEEGKQPLPQDFLDQYPEFQSRLESFFADYFGMQRMMAGDADTTWIGKTELPVSADRYEILTEIARGGMGAIHRVRDTLFDRPLALKTLREDRNDQRLQQRFLIEARITGQLQHPGIPPVHDVGRLPGGELYFSMKLIEGRTLQDLLSERKHPADSRLHFLGVFEQVCQTLAYAHSQNVIHRDLKPLNIMVGEFAEVQVMDWGMARQLQADDSSGEESTVVTLNLGDSSCTEFTEEDMPETVITPPIDSQEETVIPEAPESTDGPEERMTRAGEIMGTLTFMPPEQALGQIEKLNKRSDVFGLGAILCQILTGQPPYTKSGGNYLVQAQRAKLSDAYARLDACGADAELIELCKQCLTPEPEARPRDAGVVAVVVKKYLEDFQQRLEQARLETVEAETQAIEEKKRFRVVRMVAMLTILLVLGASAGGIWYFRFQSEKQADVRMRTRLAERQAEDAMEAAEKDMQAINSRLMDRPRYQILANDREGWALTILNTRDQLDQAKKALNSSGVGLSLELQTRWQKLDRQVEEMANQYQLAKRLEMLRFDALANPNIPAGHLASLAQATRILDSHFRVFGWDIANLSEAQMLQRLRQVPHRFAIVDALDFRALLETDPNQRKKLLRITKEIDPDPWRNRLRDVSRWTDKEELLALTNEPASRTQPPATLGLLGVLLHRQGIDVDRMMQFAISLAPKDFALHYTRASFLTKLDDPSVRKDAAGSLRAAVAIWPESPLPHSQLAWVLALDNQPEAAELEFQEYARRMEKLSPKLQVHSPRIWNNWGLVLLRMEQPEQAEQKFRQALSLNPDYLLARRNLALALENQNKLPQALEELRQVLNAAPADSVAKKHQLRIQERMRRISQPADIP